MVNPWGLLMLAETTGGGSGVDPSVLLQYGAVGFVAVAGLYGTVTLFNRLIAALERERTRADRLELELRTLNQTTQELMMGALRDATSAVSEALDVVGERRGPRHRGDQ